MKCKQDSIEKLRLISIKLNLKFYEWDWADWADSLSATIGGPMGRKLVAILVSVEMDGAGIFSASLL